jgi:hypothetical protein
MPGLLFDPAVAVTLVLGVLRRASMAWPDWVLLTAMALIGVWAVRGVAWWAPVMVLLLGGIVAGRAAPAVTPEPAVDPGTPRARRASRVNGATAALLGALVLAALPWWRPADPLTGRAGLLTYAPSGLAAKVGELAAPGARVVVPQTWGSWFEWAAPDALYFIDSRFELYPADVWADNEALVAGGSEAEAVLDVRGVDVLVVPTGRPQPGGPWVPAWADGDGTILLRAR